MSAGYTNLRVVNYRDTIAELIDRANQTHTRATGVQVFSPGDGMAYEDSEGFINPISPALFDDARDQIAEASEALVATEAELEAAKLRIDETTALLERLDEQAGLTAEEMKAVEARLVQNEKDLEAARDALTKADADAAETLAALGGKLTQNTTALAELSSDLGRVDSAARDAADKADTASQKLSAAETRLNTTQSTLEALVPRVGSVETAVRASDEKMTRLSSEATEASSAAQQAMSAAQAAEARVQALANAQGSLIVGGGFESAQDATTAYRTQAADAYAGSYVGRFTSGANRVVKWPEVRAAASQKIEVRFVARVTSGTTGLTPRCVLRVRNNDDTTTVVGANASASIQPTVSTAWQEYVFRFPALPAGAKMISFETGALNSSGSTGALDLDEVTAYDTASYQEALDSAIAAKAVADKAAADALAAMTRANQAYDSAAGKTSVRNANTAPQGNGTSVGDTWFRWTTYPGGVVTGQWSWDGTKWNEQRLSHETLASVDLGKATVGQLHGSYVTAGSLGADRIAVGVGENALADPYFQDVVFSAERASTSLGEWTRKSSGSSITYTTASTTSPMSFRYGGINLNRVIPTTGGRNWHFSAVVDSGGGGARINVRWYNTLGASTYAAAAEVTTGTGKRTISADWTAPEDATGFLIDINFPVSSTARTCTVYGGAAVRAKTGSVLIENGAVKAKQVDAESVAGAVGQFVKVQAHNVEVTEALSARVVEALSVTSKRLVVTEDAILNRATVIQELVAPVVKATKVSTDQLIAGTASLDTATANKLFADIFAANKITAAQIVVGGLPGSALANGAVETVKIADGAVTAGKITVTGELATNIFTAVSATTAESFVRDRLVVGGAFEVLGTSIVNDLNVRGTLRGRDAILAGTLDVKQLNVTEDMAAQIVSAMTVNTKKLVVTEAAVMQHVTAIEGIITPKITASEARIGDLLAGKASIDDIAAGNVTLSGHFRSGAEGKPSVIIPQNYTTQAGMEQLGVWLSPSGVAPSLGSEWGMIAGMWLDQASNVTGSTNMSPLHVRGQSGAGVRLYGEVRVSPKTGINLAVIKGAGTNMQIEGDNGRDVTAYADRGGAARLYVSNGSGDATVQANGSGAARLWASGSGDARVVSTGSGNVRIYSEGRGNVDIDAAGVADIRGSSDANIKAGNVVNIRSGDGTVSETGGFVALRNLAGNAYGKGTPSSGSWVSLFMDVNNGRVYRSTSARRYKANIEPFVPDPAWLDMPVVTYVDAQDPENGRQQIGTIAEDALDHGAEPLVMWSSKGAEDYRYEREVPVLRYFLREQRDQISALEERIAELESALL